MATKAFIALLTLTTLAAVANAAISGDTKAAAAAPAPAPARSKLSCSDAVTALIPCGSYLLGNGGKVPTAACCSSAQALNKKVATKADREALCQCLEQMGPSFGVKPEFSRQLPIYCKIPLKIPISSSANCTQA